MNPLWKEILWHQFGAAIETLQNALNACPEELWQAPLWRESEIKPEFTEFWYVAYHAIFWLDYYCSESADGFAVSPPFTHSEVEMNAALPEQVYTKQELQTYLEYPRARCRKQIESLADENEPQRVRDNWRVKTVAELLLYNMRHVKEHAAHLSMLLGKQTDSAPGWVGQLRFVSPLCDRKRLTGRAPGWRRHTAAAGETIVGRTCSPYRKEISHGYLTDI